MCIFSDVGRDFFSYSYLTSLGFVGVFFCLIFSLSTASVVLLVVM